ncbi:DUF6503 family protein [Algibacter pectinivorans]|uniref:Outer membrane lipoprotein-sorting protein n=1 Tax=Algibacter pectinivorans TaxID=870482 RepID=A0A1I1S6F0_9FLAO|nr:DUF6503 family protein [Algibacter pectinivorans]SFD39403.1 hypothetical protein SAMN04487987_11216 [Algibacter pectinivorans]
MKKIIFTLVLVVISSIASAQTGKELVAQAIEAIGGKQNFYNLGSVEYDLEYRTPPGEGATTLIAHETYVFDGELSHASYKTHSLTGANGKVIEGYNGKDAWVTFDGKVSDDQQANGVARFLRKTNYYWFSMFFKLLDDGVNYEKLSDQKVNGNDYNRVKITFGDTVGDAQDTYILYINKETKTIDQFLFTVVAFGLLEPNLMTFDYETINGIKIPSKRKYVSATWEGKPKDNNYTITNWTNIKFGINIDKTMFEKP